MNRPDVLTKISLAVAAKLLARKSTLSCAQVLARVERKPRDFVGRLQRGVNIIAEVKFRSPSQSESAHAPSTENAVKIAGAYLQAGAAALSILTEADYFKGSPDFLRAVRSAYPESYLLMKDFIIDEYQIAEAAYLGADCILLIVALLDGDRLKSFYQRARSLGLSVLVEVHSAEEMQVAIELGAELIGINNRNLKTLGISLETSRNLVSLPPARTVLVCESGISAASEIEAMVKLGFTGFLIGSSLMKTKDPGETLGQVLGGLKS